LYSPFLIFHHAKVYNKKHHIVNSVFFTARSEKLNAPLGVV